MRKNPWRKFCCASPTRLSVTLAELLGLPTVRVKEKKTVLSRSLVEFKKRMDDLGKSLSEEDLQELASMSFRGGRPRTADEWHDLYFTLERMGRRKKHGEK